MLKYQNILLLVLISQPHGPDRAYGQKGEGYHFSFKDGDCKKWGRFQERGSNLSGNYEKGRETYLAEEFLSINLSSSTKTDLKS